MLDSARKLDAGQCERKPDAGSARESQMLDSM